MSNRRKVQWITLCFIVLVAVTSLFFFLIYQTLPDQNRRLIDEFMGNGLYLLFALLSLWACAAFGVDLLYRLLVEPLNRLVEEISLIGMVNSRHRLKVDGGIFFRNLVQAVNAIAVRFEAIQKYDQEKIKSIKAEVEKERNILAAIMAELPEGVLVCNHTGRILLYNQRAKQFLSRYAASDFQKGQDESKQDAFVGLGRSIYSVMDKNQIQHALDEIEKKLKNNQMNVVAYFVAVGRAGEMLRVETVPVLNQAREFTGFILIFEDITQHLQTTGRVAGTLSTLAREIRASSANIRTTIETILNYPDMERARLDRFREIIHKESVALGEIIARMNIDRETQHKTHWPLAQVRLSDLIQMLVEKAAEKLGISIRFEAFELPDCVQADTYILTLAILFMLSRINQENGSKGFSGRVERSGSYVHLDLSWSGKPLRGEVLRQWDALPIVVESEQLPFTFQEVIGHHGAEICAYSDLLKKQQASLRLFLPVSDTSTAEQVRLGTILPQSRPEFFDFDLFEHAESPPELADCMLTEISYTVFDTETTGLDPDSGDEIISIGAVRIVNGRLLREECFDQLIDPKRTISSSSLRIHGIQAEMLKDHPSIDKVLPRFQRFAADTILVAHNAAFDMRMLQVKEESTGIRFTNPVLDTLLLSAVIHPAQEDHTLEAIAERLGVAIVGRHTAMGDAVATAKLFLKMIPLLAEKGILTLQEAMAASRKTYYARIKY